MSKPEVKPCIITFTIDDKTTTIYLDASLDEKHGRSAEVTEHKSEKGIPVADNVNPKPQRLTLEGFITNTPLALPRSQADGVTGSVQTNPQSEARVFTYDSPFDRVATVHDLISQAMGAPAIWGITTTLQSYDSMACESYDVPRNVELGQVLRFTASFKKIRTVEANTVAALPAKTKPKNKGAKTGKEAEGEQKKQIQSIGNKAVGALGFGSGAGG